MPAILKNKGKTKLVSIYSIMRKATFKQGFEDYRAGLPLRDIYDTKEMWSYERGRQFAACGYDGPLKIGQKLTLAARLSFYRHNGDIL
jgi:hypothetical protein